MERRTSPRQIINYPVWVICLDKQNVHDDQCSANAKDISESGMLIEASVVIRARIVKILASSAENKIIELAGSVVYTENTLEGKFRVGIRFIGSEGENALFAEKLIDSFRLLEATREQVVNIIVS